MEIFVQWLVRAEKQINTSNAEEVIAEAFIRFVTIHSFRDANGRTARLLLNLLLARHGRPMIDISLINWGPRYTGYLSLMPYDSLYFAKLIRDAEQGISTVDYKRYGIGKDVEIMDDVMDVILGRKQWSDIREFSENQVLSWLRGYVGSAPPNLDLVRNVYEKAKMSDSAKREFMTLIYVAQERAGREDDQRRFGEVVRYFERAIPASQEIRQQIEKNRESLFKLDNAQLRDVGGIDLTPTNSNLLMENSDGSIKFHFDSAMLQQVQNAAVFSPVVVSIEPTNLRSFLGISKRA
jgi:hypothetical protein